MPDILDLILLPRLFWNFHNRVVDDYNPKIERILKVNQGAFVEEYLKIRPKSIPKRTLTTSEPEEVETLFKLLQKDSIYPIIVKHHYFRGVAEKLTIHSKVLYCASIFLYLLLLIIIASILLPNIANLQNLDAFKFVLDLCDKYLSIISYLAIFLIIIFGLGSIRLFLLINKINTEYAKASKQIESEKDSAIKELTQEGGNISIEEVDYLSSELK